MPSVVQHNEQYVKNKEHLKKITTHDTPPLDWVVTVSFYCAVHLVEKELAKHNKHPLNHKERFNFMNERMTLDAVASAYQMLYNESRTSRYKCKNISQSSAATALKYLNKIEAQLA